MKKLKLLSTTAYDNSTGWKLDTDGHIEMKDGNPIYLNAAGQEMIVDQGTVTRLGNEAKTHREAKETAEKSLKVFEGLDPVKAKEALITVGKLDAKTLVDSGKVDELKAQITSQFQTQIAEKDKAYNELNTKFDSMQIDSVFSGSEFVRNSIAVPIDMFQDSFRKHFKVEEGKVTAYGKDGNRLMSKTRVGEYATADEALQLLVDSHSQKDVILKADVGSGSGSGGDGGNRPVGNTVIKRADFDKLTTIQKAETSAKVGKGEMTLTD